jgi:hypothetical protein
MASISYNDAGTWRTITAPSYNDAGTWRTLSEVHYNDAGTWRKVFGAGGGGPSVSLPATDSVLSTGLEPADWILKNNGILHLEESGTPFDVSGMWLTSSPTPDTASAALYEVRRTQISGTIGITFTGTMTSGTWYPLNADRGISIITGSITRENTSLWEIRAIAVPGTILASCTVQVQSSA